MFWNFVQTFMQFRQLSGISDLVMGAQKFGLLPLEIWQRSTKEYGNELQKQFFYLTYASGCGLMDCSSYLVSNGCPNKTFFWGSRYIF